MQTIIIAAHPDDELLGAGGTLLKLADAGHEVVVVHATDSNQHFDRDAFVRATGFRCRNLGFGTCTLDATPLSQIMERLGAALDGLSPERAYLPHPGDAHSDHRALFDAAFPLFKSFRGNAGTELLCCEVPSSTDTAPALPHHTFTPNLFEDVSAAIDRKCQLFEELFPSEVIALPAARNAETIKALARVRGAQAGCTYAEGFALLRSVR